MDDLITWERALLSGMTEHEIRSRVTVGEWVRLTRGWYATRRPRDDADLHLLRVAAVEASHGERAAVSHTSAALRWGMPIHELDLTVVHMAYHGPSDRSRRQAGLHLHASPRRAFEPRRGTEHPAIAVLQVAALSLEAGLVAADDSLKRGLFTLDDLQNAAQVMGRCRGGTRMRHVAAHADGRHESPGETLTALQLRLAGIEVEPQFVIPGSERWTRSGWGYRADFRVKGERVLIEFDGRCKYGRGDDVWREKRREDQIRGLGWIFVRPVWTDVRSSGRVAAAVRSALVQQRASCRETPAS